MKQDKILKESSEEDLSSLTKKPYLETQKNTKTLQERTLQAKKQSSLSFLLVCAYQEILPEREIRIAHSFGDGYFCHDQDPDFQMTDEIVSKLKQKMLDYIQSDEQFKFQVMERNELGKIFHKKNYRDKIQVLKAWGIDNIRVVKFRNHIDYEIEPIESDKSKIQVFDLIRYQYGLLLRFSSISNPNEIKPFTDLPKTWALLKEHEAWNKKIGCTQIGDLNAQIVSKTVDRLKWLSEGLHEKKLSLIAGDIIKQFPQKKIITIAGPSSSGKTTFAKRLSIHLGVNGFSTQVISMDDFYRDVTDIGLDENGNKDFESIDAMNIELLSERLNKLIEGQTIPLRRFDFIGGKGYDDPKETMCLKGNEFMILEGIHGLNPQFTEKIGLEKISRIYVSPYVQLTIDRHHRVSTADNRLLRRMIRDFQYRGWLPSDTLTMWTNVRKGEEKYIFPFQEMNDYMFNTSLLYELPVLADFAKPLLSEISGNKELEKEAGRLLVFLSFFYQIPGERVPGISILREFIGDSDFRY
ncbi:phosphoribulokinase family protein-related protein [Anaeramoeba ignava]|uniref:Phosphoribulokinase family protein-related protein n=1 Tax=Anaeramoeba ignava TaxID=1746090 RepID=A0A9Q0RCY9_ANAIG|nr:phosphoribulokinase family protein-related protein [Anaeramoeba ignava]